MYECKANYKKNQFFKVKLYVLNVVVLFKKKKAKEKRNNTQFTDKEKQNSPRMSL